MRLFAIWLEAMSDPDCPLASTKEIRDRVRAFWAPPAKLSLSEWADQHFVLSAESSAAPGRWKTIPYQKGIMDAITDPLVVQVSVIKSARVGYTKILNATIGYYVHQSPCSILVVQPTVEDAKGYSKEEIAPMLRDCPALAGIVFADEDEKGAKDSSNTILSKTFPGGVLSMVGANSGTGFRRVSRKIVLFDEVDGYPPSAGAEGDQIKLGIRRTEYFWDRKIVAGSTPLTAGCSRIETLFAAGDQCRYHVPCPQCGHFDYLVWTRGADGKGHAMRFDPKNPEGAFFECSLNGCVIEEHEKRGMVERGKWVASTPFSGHKSFHIWAAYSYSPNATWSQLASEFLEAKDNVETLKTFVNTVLGETWTEKGEAPDWERLYSRRESYSIGSVPPGVLLLTAGVDVQKDRCVYEVVGWGEGKESWSIDSGVIPMDTANDLEWTKLDQLLDRSFLATDGRVFSIALLAIDSGYQTQMVYGWARRHSMSRVISIKGVSHQKTILGTPTPVDVKMSGGKFRRGYRVWPVGVDLAKAELYGWLKLASQGPGWLHFPEYSEGFFKQLTAEQLVTSKTRQGFSKTEWTLIQGRENHFLDCRIYARAAASLRGLDRMSVNKAKPVEKQTVIGVEVSQKVETPTPERPAIPVSSTQKRLKNGKKWLSKW